MSFGEVAEWSIAAVLKTVELRGSGGSNPSLSARLRSKKVSRNRYLLFLYLWRKFTCRRRCGNKRCRRAAFCEVGLQGPLRQAEGKGVKRSDQRERSSQFSLSALNSLQGVDFQPCRLFCAQKVAPKMHQPRSHTLLRAFFKFHISNQSRFPVGQQTFVY